MLVSRKKLVLFSVVFALFFPTFNSLLGGSEGYANKGSIILNCGIMLIAVVCLSGVRLDKTITRFSIWFASLFALLIGFSTLFFSSEIIFRDLFELHRPVLYLLTFLLGVYYHSRFDEASLERILLPSLLIISCIAILQPFRVVDFFSLFYTETQNIITKRATGTLLNPYDLGLLLSLLTFYSYSKLLHGSYKLINFFCFFCSILAVMMTQSRTAVFSAILGLLIISLFYMFFFYVFKKGTYKTSLNTFIILSVIVFLVFSLWSTISDNLVYLVQASIRLMDGNDTSANIRLGQVEKILTLKEDSFFYLLFGNGVSKSVMDIIENQYFLYFFRYGFFGLLLLIAVMSSFLICSFNRLFNDLNTERVHFSMAIFVWSLIFFVASFGNPFIDIIRIQFIYFFLFGYSLNFNRREHETRNAK
ncbi:TPA: O-antigen ligase family protein [Vibrio parahaemolyticus]|uniref:Polysaccharide polymerase n=1 Tax=Vibrio parahaemolyticus TaxID=670 RepID=A0A7M1W997_VIBPH|nr:hypothetical protein VP71_00018 [Vibrio parahaemolyticus]HCE2836975.1 O-antigen ligase family protein [Vibrio parahaemolyticus]HCG9202214.1 O-antigen ligase family protein [Vibrio parahaemolyticus]